MYSPQRSGYEFVLVGVLNESHISGNRGPLSPIEVNSSSHVGQAGLAITGGPVCGRLPGSRRRTEGRRREASSKRAQPRVYGLEGPVQGDGARGGWVQPDGGRARGPRGSEEERVLGRTQMALAAGMNLFQILLFLYPPGAGEDNRARKASYFPSLTHESHLGVKCGRKVQ